MIYTTLILEKRMQDIKSQAKDLSHFKNMAIESISKLDKFWKLIEPWLKTLDTFTDEEIKAQNDQIALTTDSGVPADFDHRPMTLARDGKYMRTLKVNEAMEVSDQALKALKFLKLKINNKIREFKSEDISELRTLTARVKNFEKNFLSELFSRARIQS